MVTWGSVSVLIGGLPTMLMRTAAVLVLSTFLICIIDAASNSLVSSVEEDGRERACPGEVVRYTCTVVDISNPLVASTIWSGSAFDCTLVNDVITLQHSQFGGGTQGTCGSLTAQSEGRDGTCFTSVLTLPEADEGMNGKIINCTLSGVVTAGSDTLDVASCPAPTITITEVTPESVSVSIDGYPEDTLLCNYTLMGNVTDESGQIVQTFTTTNGTSVIVDRLNLCNSYTFEVSVMCGNVVSPMTTMEFNATLTSLDCDTNLRCDVMCDDNPQTLLWDAPTNLQDGCNVAYQIEVDGVPRTTMDTFFNVADLGLPPCEEEYIITVTPILTDRIGLLERCSSEVTIVPTEGFPSPRISSIDSIYTPQGIVVNITWENADTLPQISNALVLFDCGSDDICTPVNLSDSSSSHSLTLSYSVLGLDIEFSVTFSSPFCQRRASITTSFSNILKSVDISNVTHNTAEVLVVYNSSINTLEGYSVRVTIYPLNSSGLVQLFSQEAPLPPVSALEDHVTFSFTGLKAATDYVFNVSILSTGIVIGRAESGSFTTESEPIPADSGATSLSTGAAVAIATTVTFIVTLTIGCLSGALLYHILTKLRTRSSKYHPESSGGGQQPAAPLYEDVSPPPAGGKIELRENVAYGPVQH